MTVLRVSLVFLFAITALSAHASQLGLYFDSAGRSDSRDVAAFEVFTFYVIASDVSSDISGYEFGIAFDSQLSILSAASPRVVVNVADGIQNWVVGIGGCVSASSGLVLVQYSAMFQVEVANFRIFLRGADVSSSSGAPAYLPCGVGAQRESFDDLVHATVNLKPESWGSLKERYDE